MPQFTLYDIVSIFLQFFFYINSLKEYTSDIFPIALNL